MAASASMLRLRPLSPSLSSNAAPAALSILSMATSRTRILPTTPSTGLRGLTTRTPYYHSNPSTSNPPAASADPSATSSFKAVLTRQPHTSCSAPPAPSSSLLSSNAVLHRQMLSIGRLGTRSFHASSRRAFPAPAVLLTILKSSTVIACLTDFSRILLTLLPLSAAFKIRLSRRLRLHNLLNPKESISEPVMQFYDTYCTDERPHKPECGGRNVTKAMVHERSVLLSKVRTGLSPTYTEVDAKPAQGLRKIWFEIFCLPELQTPALVALDGMSVEQKQELYTWRRFKAQQFIYSKKYNFFSRLLYGVLLLPFVAFGISLVFSLEKAPYTGRLRSIMLSPEEEDAFSAQLRGAGWYKTVITQLTTPEQPAPAIVPQADWRWAWVNSVLRQLEAGMVAECDRNKRAAESPEMAEYVERERQAIFHFNSGLIPPPPDHPLHPRPRPAAVLHEAAPDGGPPGTGQEHLAFGPPYSLLLMDNDERNALSYGFGQDGAGGVVVFTGILDEILASKRHIGDGLGGMEDVAAHADAGKSASAMSTVSFLGSLFGLSPYPSGASTYPAQDHQEPTPEQTLQLASVLAHELAHLVLSHHLEALSATQVLVPNVANIIGDLIRTAIFPVTAMLGPHVHDVIAEWTKFGVEETMTLTDVHFSRTQEREADIVALRILAYAGYDPEASVHFWSQTPTPACRPDFFETNPAKDKSSTGERFLWGYLRGRTHDSDEDRWRALGDELERWRLVQHTTPVERPPSELKRKVQAVQRYVMGEGGRA